jgi:hypothetical protein
MFANTLLLTTVIFLGLAFFLMGECQFLAPYLDKNTTYFEQLAKGDL